MWKILAKLWRDTVVGVGCVADVLERERFHLCLAHLRQALRRQRAPAKALPELTLLFLSLCGLQA